MTFCLILPFAPPSYWKESLRHFKDFSDYFCSASAFRKITPTQYEHALSTCTRRRRVHASHVRAPPTHVYASPTHARALVFNSSISPLPNKRGGMVEMRGNLSFERLRSAILYVIVFPYELNIFRNFPEMENKSYLCNNCIICKQSYQYFPTSIISSIIMSKWYNLGPSPSHLLIVLWQKATGHRLSSFAPFQK